MSVRKIVPVILARGQILDVICDSDGRFVSLTETMPPLCNYGRVPKRSVVDERETRTREWAELIAAQQASAHD